jgi:hypothetical protein
MLGVRLMAGRGAGFTMPGMGGELAGARVMVGLLGPVELGPAGGVMAPVAQPRLTRRNRPGPGLGWVGSA